MNNLMSYFGLVDARISASEKNLPVCFLGDGIDEDIVWDLSTFENMPVCPENQDCFHTLRVWTEGCQNVNIT